MLTTTKSYPETENYATSIKSGENMGCVHSITV